MITYISVSISTEPLYHKGLNPTEPAPYFSNDFDGIKFRISYPLLGSLSQIEVVDTLLTLISKNDHVLVFFRYYDT